MIIIGNPDTFTKSAKGAKTWIPLLDQLQRTDSFVRSLPVKCECHPSYSIDISTMEELELRFPNGGCLEKCMDRMICGHGCPLRCHQFDSSHKLIPCHEPCARFPPNCTAAANTAPRMASHKYPGVGRPTCTAAHTMRKSLSTEAESWSAHTLRRKSECKGRIGQAGGSVGHNCGRT